MNRVGESGVEVFVRQIGPIALFCVVGAILSYWSLYEHTEIVKAEHPDLAPGTVGPYVQSYKGWDFGPETRAQLSLSLLGGFGLLSIPSSLAYLGILAKRKLLK